MDKLKDIFFEISEKLSDHSRECRKFKERLGYDLNLENPTSFSEKVVWKKIYDRNPILPITADKYLARDYVRRIIGPDSEKILVPLLYTTDQPETIPFDDLEDDYIIKANHASGRNIIVRNGTAVDRKVIISNCREWLKRPFGNMKHEWAYQQIPRRLVIEKLLHDEMGEIPADFKFYIFHGKCRLIHVDLNRFKDRSRSIFDPNWNFLEVTLKFRQGPVVKKPENFEAMKGLAEKLGRDFDFVRIDLYTVDGQIYFGEFTHYPGSGMEKFTPESFDFELGRYWDIKQ
jgi:hypothetical protein